MQESSSRHRHLRDSMIVWERIFTGSFSIDMCLGSSRPEVDNWSLICFRLFPRHIGYWINAAKFPSLPPSHWVAVGPGPWSSMGWKRDPPAGNILGAVIGQGAIMGGFHQYPLLLPALLPTRFLTLPSEHHQETLGKFLNGLHSMTQEVPAHCPLEQKKRFLSQTCLVVIFIQINSGLDTLVTNPLIPYTWKEKHLSFFFPSLFFGG